VRVAFSLPEASRLLNLSLPAVGKAARNLEGLGIVREVTGRARNRLYAYSEYLALLTEGTEPLAR
jgi:DNA-binding Lrp family transcriptional regulator